MEKEKQAKEETQRYEVVEIATQTAPVIKDNEGEGEGEVVLQDVNILVEILNHVDKINKNTS